MDRLRAARFSPRRRDFVAIVPLPTTFCEKVVLIVLGIILLRRFFLFFLPNPATIDLARARPTLRVVFGSLRGGMGAGDLPSVPPIATLLLPFRGRVAYCL